MHKLVALGTVSAMVLALSACQTTNTEKKAIGGGIGAIVGGLLGNQVGKGSGRIVATIGGAALGAWVGYEIAKHLSEEDQKTMAQSSHAAAASGNKITWNNPKTGVSGVSEVKQTKQTTKPVKVKVLKGKVTETPPIEFENALYRVTENSKVRGGPGTDFVQVGSLKKNKEVTVLGKVIGKDWYLISEKGAGSGYVHASLLQKETKAPAPAVTTVAAAPSDVVEVTIPSGQTCRIVTQKVKLADGKEEADEVTVCKGPDGWELV